MRSGLERISGTAKAIWTIITIVVSGITAIGSTFIYIHDLNRNINELNRDVADLRKQISDMNQQLSVSGNKEKQDITDVKKAINAEFKKFTAAVPEAEIKLMGQSDDPVNSGGGTAPTCWPGTYVIRLQEFKTDERVRGV